MSTWKPRFAFATLVIGVISSLGPSAVGAAPDPPPAPTLTISTTPSALEIDLGASRTFSLTVVNTGKVAVADVDVELTADPGLTANVTSALATTLGAGESATATILVDRAVDARPTGSVLATVTSTSQGAAGTRRHADTVSLSVTGPALPATDVAAVWNPASLALERGETRSAVLVVSNPTSSTLNDVTIDVGSAGGFEVTIDGDEATEPVVVATVVAGGSTSLRVMIKRTAGAVAAESSLSTAVSFTTAPELRARALAAELKLTLRDATAAPASPLTVSHLIPEAALIQYRSTDVVFEIKNTSTHAQTVTRIDIVVPDFLGVALEGDCTGDDDPADDEACDDENNGCDRTDAADKGDKAPSCITLHPDIDLASGDTEVLRIRVTSEKPVQPGKLLLTISVESVDTEDATTSTVVDSIIIDISVLGESGVLHLLGVPSLLFVPGLIFAVILWALIKFVWPKRGAAAVPGDASSTVVFWVFALLPTLILPFVYPNITGWFLDERRDYKRAYGLDDILYVWIIAALSALALWLLGVLVAKTTARLWKLRVGDTPRQAIRKIGLRTPLGDNTLSRPAHKHAGNDVVSLTNPVASTVLIGSTIVIGTMSALETKQQDKIRKHIDEDNPLRLAFHLWRHRDSNLAVKWKTTEPLDVPTSELTPDGRTNLVEPP